MSDKTDALYLQYMMNQGGNYQQQQELARQQALVNQLRQSTQLPGMSNVGGVARAAHPLSALANVAGNFVAQGQQGDINAGQKAIGANQNKQLADLAAQIQAAQNPNDPNAPMTSQAQDPALVANYLKNLQPLQQPGMGPATGADLSAFY